MKDSVSIGTYLSILRERQGLTQGQVEKMSRVLGEPISWSGATAG